MDKKPTSGSPVPSRSDSAPVVFLQHSAPPVEEASTSDVWFVIFRVPVTTRVLTLLGRGSRAKPSLATVTGGGHPNVWPSDQFNLALFQ